MLNSVKQGLNRFASNAKLYVTERPHIFNEYYFKEKTIEKAPSAIIVGISALTLYSLHLAPSIKCTQNGCVIDEPQDKKPTLK